MLKRMLFVFVSLLGASESWTIPTSKSWARDLILNAASSPAGGPGISVPRNVLGGDLECCCANVGGSGIGTGFYRDGYCSTGIQDMGRHTVCIEATADFLEFSKLIGNDLSTPIPEYNFPGVKPGDQWCLCAQRWAQAYNNQKAPKLYLKATHERTIEVAPLGILKLFAVDLADANEYTGRMDSMREKLERIASIEAPPQTDEDPGRETPKAQG